MRFITGASVDTVGTSLQGYVTSTLAELTVAFGEPEFYGEGDKVTVEWTIMFDNGDVASIYDWKRYDLGTPEPTEVYEYHVGGNSPAAVALVKTALNRSVVLS